MHSLKELLDQKFSVIALLLALMVMMTLSIPLIASETFLIDGMEEDVSKPDHVIGTGTPDSCTSEDFIAAVAQGGVIVFNGGDEPFTLFLDEPAKVFNDANPDIVIDGGGLVTLSGSDKTRILYMNTCDPDQNWTTSHCQNQDHPRLTVQNITFANGNSTNETETTGGGAIWVRGGRFKVINSTFINNVCATSGPDVGGGAIRVFSQYDDAPVYVVNSIFGGGEGLGNVGANGGAISSIGVSWTIIDSVFSYNQAVGYGGNPSRTGTVGGGSGGAIYNDGNTMTLSISGSIIEYNEVTTHGSGIFFVTNNHAGELYLEDTIISNNSGGTWYPIIPEVSLHSDTKVTVINSTDEVSELAVTSTTASVVIDELSVPFTAFNINGYNYFKLRDLAMALRNSRKPFEVIWRPEDASILITTEETYTPVGGELLIDDSAENMTAIEAYPTMVLDGENIELLAYNISGNNYFKLRDIGKLIGFELSWNPALNKIDIVTK